MTARVTKWSVARAIAAALLLVTASSRVSATASGSELQSISDLRKAIETVLRESKTPGAAIAIVSRDKEEWVAGIGKADVAANKPVTPETLFRLGSISKSFVGLAALKLQEEGKLKLTDTVRQWVPDLAFVDGGVTNTGNTWYEHGASGDSHKVRWPFDNHILVIAAHRDRRKTAPGRAASIRRA
jgi:CubicO group peptidase (beta-lactamase class C family)